MAVCLERAADCLHVVQLMPLPSQNPIISSIINPGWFYLSHSKCLKMAESENCELLPLPVPKYVSEDCTPVVVYLCI